MKSTVVVCCLLLVVSACRKKEVAVTNLNDNRITALGHGGMGVGHPYPTNSYESIMKCLNAGADGAEVDIQLTKDSVLVAFHDLELGENTDLKGAVNAHTWAELQEAKYTHAPYLGYAISSMEQLFDHIPDLHRYTYFFDCKMMPAMEEGQYEEAYINAMIRLIEKYRLEEQVFIAVHSEAFAQKIRLKRPGYRIFINKKTFEAAFGTARDHRLYGLIAKLEDISAAQVQQAHEQGLRVALWGMHSEKDNKRAIELHPDFIQTDRVPSLVKLLK